MMGMMKMTLAIVAAVTVFIDMRRAVMKAAATTTVIVVTKAAISMAIVVTAVTIAVIAVTTMVTAVTKAATAIATAATIVVQAVAITVTAVTVVRAVTALAAGKEDCTLNVLLSPPSAMAMSDTTAGILVPLRSISVTMATRWKVKSTESASPLAAGQAHHHSVKVSPIIITSDLYNVICMCT